MTDDSTTTLPAGGVYLVTGSAGTLGRAIHAAIIRHGGRAIGCDVVADDLCDFVLDVTREEDWRAAMATIGRDHGRLDGLVNNAGVLRLGDVETLTLEDWRQVQAVNVDGTFLGCKHAMPLLGAAVSPVIVNVSSVSGIVRGARLAAYNAAKGAVRLLTKSVALHGARKTPAVRCNSLHPAFIEGPMVDGIAAAARDPQRAREKMTAEIPLGRMARPEEIASAVVWLLSPSSAFMTGGELVLDGGLTAR